MSEYIKREDAIRAVCMDCECSPTGCETGCIAVRDINLLPAADVAPVVHGRWVESQRGFLICSNCNADRLGIPLAWYMPYCYHCGCKMDLEVETDA